MQSFLKAHPEKGSATRVSGSFNGPHANGDFVVEVPNGRLASNESSLVVTFVNIGNDKVGIRGDALVVPSGAQCTSSGGGPAS